MLWLLLVSFLVCTDDQLPVRTVLLKYCDLKNISPDLLNLLRKHSPEGRDAEKLDALLADGVRYTLTELWTNVCLLCGTNFVISKWILQTWGPSIWWWIKQPTWLRISHYCILCQSSWLLQRRSVRYLFSSHPSTSDGPERCRPSGRWCWHHASPSRRASLAPSASVNIVQNSSLCVWLCAWSLSCLLQQRLHPQSPAFLVGQIFVRQNATTCLFLRQEHSLDDGVSMLQPQPSGTRFHHISDHHPLVVDSLELGWNYRHLWDLLLKSV